MVPRSDEISFALVAEDDGFVRWALPGPDGSIEVPLDPVAGAEVSRGIVGSLVRKAVQWVTAPLVDAVLGRVGDFFVRRWEQQHRPHRLRLVGNQITQLPADDLDVATARGLLAGPTLLMLHGTASSTESGFAQVGSWLDDLSAHYAGRVLALDHPTLGHAPDENARWLAGELRRLLGSEGPLVVDVVAHSRGGLVARSLVEQAEAVGLGADLLQVRSVTFAGTPNAGTPLCDPAHLRQLMDTYTNMLGLLPDIGVTDVLDTVVTVVKQLATGFYQGLDGAMSMRPDGPWLAALNRPTDARTSYRAITADYEPPAGAGVGRRLRDTVTDRVFAQVPNDLVVPTAGTVGANGSTLFPIRTHLRLEADVQAPLDHFTFFGHPASVRQLRAWLLADDTEPATVTPVAPTSPGPGPAGPMRAVGPTLATVRAPHEGVPLTAVDDALAASDVGRLRRAVDQLGPEARRELETSVGGSLAPVVAPSRGGAADGPRATVVVLPGIMGSNLDVVSGGDVDRIWVHPWRILTGQFTRLEMGADVRVAGPYRVYVPLMLALDVDHDVAPHAYDWRLSLEESAARLAEHVTRLRARRRGPIHLVAHSMGGLVARHMIARHPDAWEAAGGRLVQLGTPNRGSYAISLVLSGHDRIVSWLALADLRNDRERILRMVQEFPSPWQLLPAPFADVDDDVDRLWDAARWDAPDAQDLLARAREAHDVVATDAIDPARMDMVLGTGHPTPHRVRVLDDGSLRYGRTHHGDGKVPHDLALLTDIEPYYVGSDHGGLVGSPDVLSALPDLLAGRDVPLSREDTAVGRGAPEDLEPSLPPEVFAPPPPPTRDGGPPDEAERARLVTEVTREWLGAAQPPVGRPLDVEVVHGLVQYVDGPWLLGHVAGTPLSGSELAVDGRLGGILGDHQLVGEYPQEAGTPLVVAPHHDPSQHTIVLGLGPWGELTAPALSEAVTRGVLRCLVGSADVAARDLASVLIGTSGPGGLPVAQAVTAITTGVLAANRQAEASRRSDRVAPAVTRLRFVEMYEDRAVQAALAVRELAQQLDAQVVGTTDLRPATHLRTGRDGEPGQPPVDGGPDDWRRLVIRGEDDQLVLTLLGRKSAAPTRINGLLADVEALVEEPGQTPATDGDRLGMLWHLLVPPALRQGLAGNLQLAVDDRTAGLPWEMLSPRDHLGNLQPLSLRAGMVRQLVELEASVRGSATAGSSGRPRALVIGDPPAGRLPRLPGARTEAATVADALESAGLEVTRRIYGEQDTGDASPDILSALYSQPWEVIHVAAHGDHDPGDPRRSGIMIGPERVLRGEHVASLSSTPRLVVLNCCHLARLDRGATVVAGTPATQRALPRFAATVAQALMRQGVEAVVAAGWAINDVAAERFATTLYADLFAGRSYGNAVRTARLAARDASPTSATWGAYQCYGDAGFRLRARDDGHRGPVRPAGRQQLVRELQRLATRSRVDRPVDELATALADLLDDSPDEWLADPDCAQAIGAAHAARGDFDQAVEWYDRALHHRDGAITIRTIELLANLATRCTSFDHDAVRARLRWLDELDETSERAGLAGAAEKRHATTLRTRQARHNHVREAVAHYRRALDLATDDRFALVNILHLGAVLGEVDERDVARLDALAADDGDDFWSAVADGDRSLLRYLLGEDTTLDEVRATYEAARDAHGPTHQAWRSVLQQSATLGVLAEDEALRTLWPDPAAPAGDGNAATDVGGKPPDREDGELPPKGDPDG